MPRILFSLLCSSPKQDQIALRRPAREDNMQKTPQYQLLAEDECEEFVGGGEESEMPATLSRSCTTALLAVLLVSLLANVFFALNQLLVRSSGDNGRSPYSGITFDSYVRFQAYSEYWNPEVDQSIADRAWDALDTNPMAVSLHDSFTKEVGLAPSTRFPWDIERSIYYIKGFHDIHCLKLVRKAIVSKETGSNQTFSLHHILHCLDGLRQDIMCMADDTPMPAPKAHKVGDGQVRKCRDWGKLVAWATRPDQNACHRFDDYRETKNTLELFAFCPDESPYRAFVEAYFAYHGHKDVNEMKELDEGDTLF